MRFGIMAMQLEALAPAGISPQQAPTYIASFDHAGHVRGLATPGFNPIELGGDLELFFSHTFGPAAIDKLAALKQESGITYTVHLPIWSVEPSTPLAPVRAGSVKAVVDCIHATLPLDPEVYVLHTTGALAAEFYRMRIPEMARALVLAQFQSYARASLQSILAETGIPSRKLAIETIEFPFELTLQLANDLDLSMCLDTGHVMVGFSGPLTVFEALEQCLPRLAEIHLHDGIWQGPEHNIGYGKDHQPLGSGDLDTGAFLDRLAQAGYSGPLVFELTTKEALASIQVIKTLRPDYLPVHWK